MHELRHLGLVELGASEERVARCAELAWELHEALLEIRGSVGCYRPDVAPSRGRPG